MGFLRSFPPSEVFRKGTMCQGCTRGQQDVALSRYLFHHHPAATAPIGITGFFWGRPADRLGEQMLKFFPECAPPPSRSISASPRLAASRCDLAAISLELPPAAAHPPAPRRARAGVRRAARRAGSARSGACASTG